MKIVIDIPEEIYNNFMNDWINSPDILHAVRHGTPLPKRHGRLIDVDTLEECKEPMDTIIGECKYAVRMDDIRNVPTIIEAGSDSK